MKFSDITEQSWEELKPYLDTCLIPVTGLSGKEQPFEVTASLTRLRDIMDWIEIPFKGRVVTYPSVQYSVENIAKQLCDICHNVRIAGFTYIIVVSSDLEFDDNDLSGVDLLVTPNRFEGSDRRSASSEVMRKIQEMWENKQ